MNRRSFLGVVGAATATAAVRPHASTPSAFGVFDMDGYRSLHGPDRKAADEWVTRQAGSYEMVFLLHLRGKPGGIESAEVFRYKRGTGEVTTATHVVTEQPPAGLASQIAWKEVE